jgi:ribonucleoside-diphosphate reductase beta chain
MSEDIDFNKEGGNMEKMTGKITIFDEQISRKPNRYPWTDDFIRAMWDGHWTADEFTFKRDLHQFKTVLNDQEREIIIRTLSAIGQIEVAVKTFWGKLGENLPHPSLVDLGYVMANLEVIHNQAYEKLLKVLGLDDVFEKNLKLDWIQGRVKYLRKYTHRFYKDSKKQYLYALILFTLFVENVSLFSQFYIINWFASSKNVLNDTDQQVKYTRNEENIHALVGIKIINTIREEMPELFDEDLEAKIAQEAVEAFTAESKIIDWMINGYDQTSETNDGYDVLNAKILKEFCKNRINESMIQIGFKPPFDDVDHDLLEGALWFEVQLRGNTKTDFFHGKPTEYAKSNQSFDEDELF